MSTPLDAQACAVERHDEVAFMEGKSLEERPPQKEEEARRSKKRLRAPTGNYSEYYSKRLPPQPGTDAFAIDPRLALLQKAWFEGLKSLDVGCNSGHLTLTIAKEFSPASMLGIDADAALVEAAKGSALQWSAASSLAPSNGIAMTTPVPRGVKLCQAVAAAGSQAENLETPAAAAAASASAPPPASAPQAAATATAGASSDFATDGIREPLPHPPQVAFRQEDFILQRHGDHGYDMVTCFSVTKWVHLTHGDAGLLHLLRKVKGLLRPGGRFVLEPQPWSRYKRSKGVSAAARANYPILKLRPEALPEILVRDVGFAAVENLGVPPGSPPGFARPILLCTAPPARK